jgi:hypothetical protein
MIRYNINNMIVADAPLSRLKRRLHRASSFMKPVVRDGAQPSILGRVAEPGVVLAVWRRSAPLRLARWLDALPASQLPRGRIVTTPATAPTDLRTICDAVGLTASPERVQLVDDITLLVDVFAGVTGHDCVDLRLEAIDHDACWRFHRDHVGLRLNVTYRGPGTQWVAARDTTAALRGQRRYRRSLNELTRFSVGLFKGVTSAGDDAIVHRSPPVEGSGITRLFLCLNEVDHDA